MKMAHSLVEDLLRDLQLDMVKPRNKSLEHWKEVVGSRLSSNCQVSGWDGDVLKIRTSVPGIAMELGYRSDEIVSALNRIAGREIFSKLKVLLGPVKEQERRGFDRKRSN